MGITINFLIISIILIFTLSVASYLLRDKENQLFRIKGTQELLDRVNTWWIIILTLLFFLVIGTNATIVFFALISYLAFKEYVSHLNARQSDRRIIFWAYISIIPQYYFIAIEWFTMFLIWIPIYAFLFLPLRQVLIGETKGFIKNTASIQWGLMLFVFLFSHIAYLVTFNRPNEDIIGVELILYLLILTQGNDVFQYIWGKKLGSIKIIPKVSPNKTVEGFIGGMVSTIILSMLLSFLTPFTLIETTIAGVIISIGGFFGDVVISSIKRDLGIKDFGSLLAGHGGINDRIDSLIYTAPLFFHYINYLYQIA